MFKGKFIIIRGRVIEELAQQLARLQKKADYWYYQMNDRDHSSWLLDQVYPLKEFATKLGICEEVYERAYEIYDFRNSGKDGYTLKNGKIVKCDSPKRNDKGNSVKHGCWIPEENETMRCSNCQKTYEDDAFFYFCPNCGCQMGEPGGAT